MLNDADAMRERITGAASGLLTLMGINADPLLSPEHILISSILDNQWRQSKNVSVADLIGLIQRPPITRVGVLDLDSFMPAADRTKLAMQLNNLLASPAFSTWLEGESLSISKLLYTDSGKPRISILSIAHLSDSERMFFVTILLNELLAWMRTQSGTSSLRAIFYMDEVAGYFPPSAKPPTKPPDADRCSNRHALSDWALLWPLRTLSISITKDFRISAPGSWDDCRRNAIRPRA